MATRLAAGINCDPIGVSVLNIIISRMRICPGDDDHAELATAAHEFTKRVGVAKPLAAVMERDLCRIIGDATAGAKADRIGFRALEVVEPETRVELARIVFDKGELGPAHRFVDP